MSSGVKLEIKAEEIASNANSATDSIETDSEHKMTMPIVKIPDFISEKKSYKQWESDIDMWRYAD